MPTVVGIEALREAFRSNTHKVFIIDSIADSSYTYGQIEDLSLRLSSFLRRHAVRKGDKVALLLSNRIEFVLLYFSCMHLGAIPVPVNINLHSTDINNILSHSGARIVVAESSLPKNIGSFPFCIKTISLSSSTEQGINLLEQLSLEDRYADIPFTDVADMNSILIMYTSGTTSKPKGVVYSYKNMVANARQFIEHTGIDFSCRFYGILPLSYMAGFYNLLMVPFLAGGSVVLDKVFTFSTAFNFWKKIQKHDINALWLVPSIISILLSLKNDSQEMLPTAKNIKVSFSGTAPLADHLKETFEKRFSISLYNSYGLSELLFVSANAPRFHQMRGVGKPLSGIKVMVLGDDGKEKSSGTLGEIAVLSTCAMDGYYNLHDGTGLVMQGNTILTGDIGYVDEEGYLYVTDRKKDLIIRGGINISPREIEEVLLHHPQVHEAAIISIPDLLAGEKIVAVIKVENKMMSEDIAGYCRENLAPFKVPSLFLVVDEFPRSVTGKVQKEKLRQLVLGVEMGRIS